MLGFEQRPDFFADVGQLPLEVRQLPLDPGLNALPFGGRNLVRRRRDLVARDGVGDSEVAISGGV